MRDQVVPDFMYPEMRSAAWSWSASVLESELEIVTNRLGQGPDTREIANRIIPMLREKSRQILGDR